MLRMRGEVLAKEKVEKTQKTKKLLTRRYALASFVVCYMHAFKQTHPKTNRHLDRSSNPKIPIKT